MMTQIPEVGSVWTHGENNNFLVEVLFADDVSVYYKPVGSDAKDAFNTRGELPTCRFADYFKPKPRTITHRIWVNLRENGSAFLSEYEDNSPDIVQSHLMEWEVEK